MRKIQKKYWVIVGVLICAFFGWLSKLGEESKELSPQTEVQVKVIEKEKNKYLDKTVVRILLSERMSEEEIEKQARKIQREEQIKTARQYFYFYLPKMNMHSIPWAFFIIENGEETIFISTTNQEEFEQKKAVSDLPLYEIVGKWYEFQKVQMAFSLVKDEKGKYMMFSAIKEGGTISETVKVDTTSLGVKIIPTESIHGEYFIIEGEELGFYNAEGKRFATAYSF